MLITAILGCTLLRRHNGCDSVSSHQPHDCLLNRLFRRRSKKISKLRVTGLCAGSSPGTGEFPSQMASNAENVSIWWRHHVTKQRQCAMSYRSSDMIHFCYDHRSYFRWSATIKSFGCGCPVIFGCMSESLICMSLVEAKPMWRSNGTNSRLIFVLMGISTYLVELFSNDWLSVNLIAVCPLIFKYRQYYIKCHTLV